MKISLLFYSSVLAQQVNPSPFQIATGSMKWTPESKEFKHREALIANDIKNIKEYDPTSTVLKEKATIGYIKNSIQNCNFFIFRHHRSAADQFERIIKTDVNSYFLDLIYAIRGEISNSKMNQIVGNYETKSKRCEPILLSNVLLVEKYHAHYYAKIYSKIPEGDSHQTLLHETLYIRMRSIERSMDGGKRHQKAVDKKPSFRDDFLWKTVLSDTYRAEIGIGNKDNEKLDAYVKTEFGDKSKLPALLPLFADLFNKYHQPTQIADRKLNKPEQLLNYWFDNILVDKNTNPIDPNEDLGPNPPLLDLDFWPADQKQADQMKRWISGSNRPWMGLHYHDKYFFIDHLIKDLVKLIVKEDLQQKIAEKIGNSWFTRMVQEAAPKGAVTFPVVVSLNDENEDEHNSSIMWSTSMLFMLVV